MGPLFFLASSAAREAQGDRSSDPAGRGIPASKQTAADGLP